MLEMTSLMAELLATAHNEKAPCLVGTASKDGEPQTSPRGSVAVFDPQTLSFWEYSFRKTYQNILENPRVAIYYRNFARKDQIPYRAAAIRFYGTARIVREGAERERAWDLCVEDEKNQDPEKKGVAVLIRVDRIEDIKGKVIMQRDGAA